jgi:hypothetical protein
MNNELEKKKNIYIMINNELEEIKKYKYSKEQIKQYNKTFYEAHREPIKCDICLQMYKYHNKYNHVKTKVHRVAQQIKDNFKKEEDLKQEEEIKIRIIKKNNI